MKAILLFCLFALCACSSTRISDVNTDNLGDVRNDFTTELSNLPRVVVQGEGRMAKIKLSCGSNPSFVLNGNLEPEYAYLYDQVKNAKLKVLRVQNVSDATLFGLRGENSTLIIIETE